MIGILGGLGAAVAWATSTLFTSRSSRMVSPVAVLAWVSLIGAVLVLPFVAVSGVPREVDGATLGWLAVIGAANLSGLLLVYTGLRIGKVGIVAPISSAEGAVAAAFAVLAGERVAAATGGMLALITIGVVLSSVSRETEATARKHNGTAVVLATVSALLLGLGMYATGRLSDEVPLPWVLVPARLLGTVVLAAPLALTGRMRLTREARPLVVGSGLLEILGLTLFTLGARYGIAIPAVLSSQFAALAAVAAYFLFRERLARIQVVGVAAILVGVAVLTGLRA